jgi:hypothetical protein
VGVLFEVKARNAYFDLLPYLQRECQLIRISQRLEGYDRPWVHDIIFALQDLLGPNTSSLM